MNQTKSQHFSQVKKFFYKRKIKIPKNKKIKIFKGATDNDDVVICYAKRTAIGKAKKGSFKDTTQDQLLAPLLKNAVETLKLNPHDIGDVVIGNVLPKSSQGSAEVR
jgi:hypothetical protein